MAFCRSRRVVGQTIVAIKRLTSSSPFYQAGPGVGFLTQRDHPILFLRNKPETSRAVVNAAARAKLADIEEKIERMTKMRDALAQMNMLCDGKVSIEGCPILQSLERE